MDNAQKKVTFDSATATLFYDHFPEGLIRIDQNNVIYDVNSTATTLLGWNESELIGDSIHNHLCADHDEYSHAPEACPFLVQDETTGEAINSEAWWITQSGTHLYIDLSYIQVNHPTGPQLLIKFQDCSEKEFSASELKRLSQFAELSPTPVLQLDENAVIYYANPAVTELMVEYGFDDNGQPNIFPEDLAKHCQLCVQQNGTLPGIESHHQERWYFWYFHPMVNLNPPLVQVYGVDITARKKFENHLLELKNLAEFHTQQKSLFVASMSHELRTPMNGVIGLANILLNTNLSSQQREYTNKIILSGQSLLYIVNDILDISKIEAGKLDINLAPFSLHSVIIELCNLLDITAQDKNIAFEVRIDPTIPPNLIGDCMRIRQIVMNFLSNAIKFTQQGSVFLDISRLEQTEETVTLCMAVKDTGIGITEDKLSHVFGEYQQAETTTTSQYGGTGLGLSICKKLAELMGGCVGVDSTPGEGSNFYCQLTFPIAKQTVDAELDIDVKFDENCRVLVVAGNAIYASIIEELLHTWGIEMHYCAETEQAIRYLESTNLKTQKDMILMICTPYDQTHIAPLLDLTQRQKNPTIFVERQKNPATEQGISHDDYYQRLGAAGYLIKPYTPNMLKSLLSNVWGNEQPSPLEQTPTLQESQVPIKTTYDVNILVVDDDGVNQQVAKVFLETFGCDVEIASNGEEAVEKWQTTSYAVIFMDCQMPIMDGYQATQQIRQLEATNNLEATTIVALTGNVEAGHQDYGKEQGMNDFITKPIDPESIAKILQKWVSAT